MRNAALIKSNNFVNAPNFSSGGTTGDLNHQVELLKIMLQQLLNEIEAFEKKSLPQFKKQKEIDLTQEVEQFETDLIRRALILAKGKQCEAARLLQIKNTTLNAKIKRYGIKYHKTQFIEEVSSRG